jgi:hypothetical protein
LGRCSLRDSFIPPSSGVGCEGRTGTVHEHDPDPDLTAPEIFWVPRDMEEQMQPRLAQAARLMLADLDGHEGYSRWFQGGSNPPGLPERSGYYLGYLMAKQLDHGELAALARIPPKQVAIEARKFLESLAARARPTTP